MKPRLSCKWLCNHAIPPSRVDNTWVRSVPIKQVLTFSHHLLPFRKTGSAPHTAKNRGEFNEIARNITLTGDGNISKADF